MRNVLVTGSNSGFGAACVEAFSAAGDTVVATVRQLEAAPPEGGSTAARVDVRALDVTEPESIRSCIVSVLADYGHVDVLVNNAGIHLLGAVEDMDESAFRRVFETNFFGAIALARELLPSMRARGRGRVISVSSIGAQVGRVIDGAYCASKAALEIAMEAMRHEVARFGVHVSVVAPGAYRTRIDRNFDAPEGDGAASPYRALRAFRRREVAGAVSRGGDPAEVARAILAIADEPVPAFRYVVGDRARDIDRTLAGLDDAGRQALITRLARIDWWLGGKDAPPDDAGEDAL